MNKQTSANSRSNRRLVLRLITLGVFVSMPYFFHISMEVYGVITVTIFYVLWIFIDFGVLGHLKSRPDTSKISITEFFNEDSISRYFLVLYFLLMILAFELIDGDAEMGHDSPFIPLGSFVFGAFIFWRMNRLEVQKTET